MTTEAVYGPIMPAANAIAPGGVAASPLRSSENRQPADTGTAFTKDHDAPLCKRLSDEVEVVDDEVRELFDSPALDPADVDDRWPGRPGGCQDRPEVGVSRDQRPVFDASSVKDYLVGCVTQTEIRGVHRVMTMLCECRGQARRQILIHQELHAG